MQLESLPSQVRDKKETSKRIIRFVSIGLLVLLLYAMLDYARGLVVSTTLILIMAFVLSIILFVAHKGYNNAAIIAVVIAMNILLTLTAFAEGLQASPHLFILPLIIGVAFLLGDANITAAQMIGCFIFSVCCFCTVVFFCDTGTSWQRISPELADQMFKTNSTCVAIVCAVFAYMGIFFERRYTMALIISKNNALKQEQYIKGQNEHLKDIAFLSAHEIRAPLANILGLLELIDTKKIVEPSHLEILEHLQQSASNLDEVIKKIVVKTRLD